MRRYTRIAIPAALLIAVSCVLALAWLRWIPSPGDLVAALAHALGAATPTYIAVCAILENIVGINVYFPGAFVILFAMASTHGDLCRAASMFATIVGASAVAQHVNYLLGRLLRQQFGSPGGGMTFWGGVLSYWHPQLGALYSFRIGLSAATYPRFALILTAWACWTTFWGVAMYVLGSVPLSGNSFVGIFVLYLVGWFVLEVVKARKV
ncbi:MAG TPA: hypothetical protein VJ276_08000 [Thermoanaerobaculia bacterium]|nr:hypothetical protein [Thermoanaerobaculia bacterium]